MTTPIWDDGNVLASMASTTCDRCMQTDRALCIQLWCNHDAINLCADCFCELALLFGMASPAEALRGAASARDRVGKRLFGEPSPFARRPPVMTDADREFLNRTWCAICQSHFCSCKPQGGPR